MNYYQFFIYLIGMIFLASCAAKQTTTLPRKNDALAHILKNQPEKSPVRKELSDPTRTTADIENMTIDDVIRIEEPNTQTLYDNSRYDFPITINSKVEGWIDYFTGKGRYHMERYLGRSGRYLPIMKQILKRQGLPEDLVYLALIESGFNLRAKSRAKAVGAWQFMKATGKRYGLRVDGWVDERRDPVLSTEAAANYLKDLYLMFESWYLAASAYNAGEYKILRAIEVSKTNNFWGISETKLIRRETKDYIPKLIAAAIIAKNPHKYGFSDVTYQEPLDFDTIQLNNSFRLKELAKICDAAEDDLLDLNPQYIKGIVPPGGHFVVRLPPGKKLLVERMLAGSIDKTANELPIQYTVQSKDTLASVAKKFRTNVNELANNNNMSKKEKLTSGMTILIPSKKIPGFDSYQAQKKTEKRTVTAVQPQESLEQGYLVHTVKKGESLWSISEHYDVTIQNIFKWNSLRKSQIHPGKKLKIKENKKSSAKSLEDNKSITSQS